MKMSRKSYRKKVFSFIFALMLLLSLLIIGISYWQNNKMFQENLQRENESAVLRVQSTLDTVFRECTITNSYNYVGVDAQLFMESRDDAITRDGTIDELFEETSRFRYIKGYIYEIGFYSQQADLLLVIPTPLSQTVVDTSGDYYREVCDYLDSLQALEIAYYPHWDEQHSHFLLSFIKKNAEGLGATFLSINMKMLSQFIPADEVTTYYIISDDGQILYSSDMNEMGRQCSELTELENWTPDAEETVSFFRKDSLISTVKSTRYNWHYVAARNAETGVISQEQQIFIGTLFTICMAAGLLYAVFISRKANRPLIEIMELMSSPAMLHQQYSTEEVQFIAEKLTSVLAANTALQSSLEERIKSLNTLQNIALQYQINPHFLFNTLNLMSVIASKELGVKHRLVSMISKLSAILRYSLEVDENTVSLEKELAYTKLYLDILLERHHDAFTVEYQIEEDALRCAVLRLSLQPLVENAIYHGIQPVGSGKLTIGAACKNDVLQIWVSDNGIGMSEENVAMLNERIHDESLRQTHIGLANVHKRIQLLFGGSYGVEVTSREGNGTQVSLRLPIIEEIEC